MGKGNGTESCMKWCLVILNCIVLVAAGIAIGIGAWSYASDYGADQMRAITGSSLYEAGCIIVIAGGCIVFIVALLGACGAFTENRAVLAIYFSILIILLILFAVAAVLGFFYRDDLRERLEDEMEETLINEYDVDDDGDGVEDHSAVTEVWNKIQERLDCCGVSGGLNSEKSWFLWQQSKWFRNQPALNLNKPYVPSSCCNIDGGFTIPACSQLQRVNTAIPIQEDPSGVTAENPALFHNGCVDALEDKIEDHIIAIAGIAIVVLVLMLCSVFFAICLFVQVRNKNMIV